MELSRAGSDSLRRSQPYLSSGGNTTHIVSVEKRTLRVLYALCVSAVNVLRLRFTAESQSRRVADSAEGAQRKHFAIVQTTFV
jgi:hypothetical protein